MKIAPPVAEEPLTTTNLLSKTLPGSQITSYQYDPASQVTAILQQPTVTNTPINKADYLYNGVGNRTTGESVVNVENGG